MGRGKGEEERTAEMGGQMGERWCICPNEGRDRHQSSRFIASPFGEDDERGLEEPAEGSKTTRQRYERTGGRDGATGSSCGKTETRQTDRQSEPPLEERKHTHTHIPLRLLLILTFGLPLAHVPA